MKVQISITTDGGAVYSGELELDRALENRKTVSDKQSDGSGAEDAQVNFDLPLRAFMKKYAQSISGPRRLTLLVAWLAKGESSVEVGRAEASKAWNKMRGLMGGAFNSAYETRARDNGWLNSPKAGVYTLLSNWRDVL